MAAEVAATPAIVPPTEEAPAASASADAFLSPSLYVGDLHQDVTEAVLFEKFSTAGQISSIRVCRDAITRRSLGYAYVNYHNPRDADRALDTMNFETLNGYPMRIMWSQRDPAVRRSGAGNVFIKNLAPSIDNKSLFDTFSQFGNILSAKVACDRITGASQGYGFVHFQTQEAAEKAIEMVNGMLMENQKVYVAKFVPRNQRSESVKLFTNIFIKNLQMKTDEELKAMFGVHGTITSAVIMKAGENNATKGFGFVNFETPESAEAAVNALNGKEQGEGLEPLYVARAQKKSERQMLLKQQFDGLKKTLDSKFQGVNLYVKNLDENIDDAALRALFTDFGVITSALVMKDEKTKISKGFGFVCFSAPEEATKAVTEMNGKLTRKRPLYVALAIRKQERLQQQALLRAQYRPQMGIPMANPMGMNNMYAPQGQMYYPNYYQQQMPNVRGFGGVAGQPGSRGPRGGPQGQFPGGGPMGMGMQQQYRGQAPQGAMGPGGARGNNAGNAMRQPRGGNNFNAKQGGAAGNFNNMAAVGGNAANAALYAANAAGRPAAANNAAGGRAPQHVLVNPQSVRNPSMPATAEAKSAPREQVAQDALLMEGQAPLTAAALANADLPAQKQMLGERLYPVLRSTYGETAAKIAGMLLEMDNSELLHLLEDSAALTEKAKEAVQVLNDSMN